KPTGKMPVPLLLFTAPAGARRGCGRSASARSCRSSRAWWTPQNPAELSSGWRVPPAGVFEFHFRRALRIREAVETLLEIRRVHIGKLQVAARRCGGTADVDPRSRREVRVCLHRVEQARTTEASDGRRATARHG